MRILLEATAERRAGFDRGIGRYVSAVRSANAALGNEVDELICLRGERRTAEISAMVRRSSALIRRQYDVFHAPTAYYGAVDLRGRPVVTSILDLIPLEVAEHRKTGLKAKLVHRVAAAGHVVLTLSMHAAGRIESLLGVHAKRIVVAPLPPASSFEPIGPTYSGVTAPYVAMMVDLRTPDPRKRAHWIPVLAGELVRHGITIVVVGGGTEALRLPGVMGLGRVDDASWASVLRGAEALVYTPAYEGQGLPPLEAIACGTPVISMSNTAIPEVVGSAGVLLDDHDGDRGARVLAATTIRVLRNPTLRASLSEACPAQAGRFTPQRFAEQVRIAYVMAKEQS